MNAWKLMGLLAVLGLVAPEGLKAACDHPAGQCLVESDDEKEIDREGSGDVPIPYDVRKEKYELSHGEEYVLTGMVSMRGGKYLLLIDFEAMPWLQTAKRKLRPYYQLSSEGVDWTEYAGRDVRFKGRAELIKVVEKSLVFTITAKSNVDLVEDIPNEE